MVVEGGMREWRVAEEMVEHPIQEREISLEFPWATKHAKEERKQI